MDAAGQETKATNVASFSSSETGCRTTTGCPSASPKIVGAICRQVGQLMQLVSTKNSPGTLAGWASFGSAMNVSPFNSDPDRLASGLVKVC